MKTVMKFKLRLIAISMVMFTTVGCDQVTKGAARIYLSPEVPLIYLKGIVKFIISIGPFRTGIFNVAGVAGMVGAGLFLIQLFRTERNIDKIYTG